MKLRYITLAAVACLAPLYALGCVGSFEAGHMSMLGLFVRCVAAAAAQWASMTACCKLRKERAQ